MLLPNISSYILCAPFSLSLYRQLAFVDTLDDGSQIFLALFNFFFLFYISAPQTIPNFTYLQICLFSLMPSQIFCGANLVSFSFQVLYFPILEFPFDFLLQLMSLYWYSPLNEAFLFNISFYKHVLKWICKDYPEIFFSLVHHLDPSKATSIVCLSPKCMYYIYMCLWISHYFVKIGILIWYYIQQLWISSLGFVVCLVICLLA